MEQNLFSGQIMKMCGTVPNMAHKSDLGADSALTKISKCWLHLQFDGADFGLILLMILCELDYGPLIGIIAGMKGYNFCLDHLR